MVMAAAGSFAAISTVFGSPVIGAVILIEAAGLGGATLPVVLLPGLIAAGLGSLVFIGLGAWSGLSTSAWALSPFDLPPFSQPTAVHFVWAVVLAIVAAVVVFAIVALARVVLRVVARRPVLFTMLAGVAVGGLAIAFNQVTDQPTNAVLFSGQDAFSEMLKEAPDLSLSVFAWLLLFKGVAWSISLGSFRGGPTFPALFLGTVGGTARGGPARALGDAGRRGADGRGLRLDAAAAAVLRRHRAAPDVVGRTRRRPADHRRGHGGVRHHRGARRPLRARTRRRGLSILIRR